MAQDERFTPGSHNGSTDELDDTAARLDGGDFDNLDTGYAAETAPHQADGPGMLQGFLEQQLRRRPLPTLLAAVAAGWVVGKLLR